MKSQAIDGRTARAERRRENRRAAILDAALRVFGEKGYHQTHVSDIIAEAGIARGTFYLYFESKSAIFLELLDGLLIELRGTIVGVETEPGAPPMQDQLQDIVGSIIRTIVDNRLLSRIIIREAVGIDAEVDQRLRDFYQKLTLYIRLSLKTGQQMGLVRELDVGVAAVCILGGVKQFMEQYVMDDGADVDVDRIAFAVLDFNLRGLLA